MYSIKDKKAPVLEIQRLLIILGYGESHLVPMDGIYGENTRLAVMNLQQRNGLSVTGTFDYETYLVLIREYEQKITKDSGEIFPLREGDKSEYVRILHAYLNLLFSRRGAAQMTLNGDIFNEKTSAYVTQFLSRIGANDLDEISEEQFLRLSREVHLSEENNL